MNVIVTGASGLLGRAVVVEFKGSSWKVLGLAFSRARDDLVQIDLTDNDAVSKIVREFKPHAIIHCAAERSPDKLEEDPERYHDLNVEVPGKLAKLAKEVEAVFVYISSDYVFSGDNPPYYEHGPTVPLNAYGMSKVDAEELVIKANPDSCILRIPVIYGGEECVEESAVSSLIVAIKQNGTVRVANCEVRYPSHTKDIAKIIHDLVQKKRQDESIKQNVFQWSGLEQFTKYEMAVKICQTFGLPHDHLIPNNLPSAGPARPRNAQMVRHRLENLGIGHHTAFVEGIEEFRKFFQ